MKLGELISGISYCHMVGGMTVDDTLNRLSPDDKDKAIVMLCRAISSTEVAIAFELSLEGWRDNAQELFEAEI